MSVDDRRRLERDLHDGIQNELVALIVKLGLAAEDRDTPAVLASTLSALTASAEATLDSVREIARGIYPPLLAHFGVLEALRAQAARTSIDVSLAGTAPRSTEGAEAAVYFLLPGGDPERRKARRPRRTRDAPAAPQPWDARRAHRRRRPRV